MKIDMNGEPQDKEQLGSLIKKMKSDGAPESAIKLAVEKFKKKNVQATKEPTEKEPTESASTSEGGDSSLGSQKKTSKPYVTFTPQEIQKRVENISKAGGFRGGRFQELEEKAEQNLENFDENGVLTESTDDVIYIGEKAYSPKGVEEVVAEQYKMFAPSKVEGEVFNMQGYTEPDIMESLREDLKKVKNEKANTASASRFPDERRKYKELREEEERLENLISDSEKTNNNIIAEIAGSKYVVDGEEKTYSQFQDILLNEDLKEKDIVVENDPATQATLEFQLKALSEREDKFWGQESLEDLLANSFDAAVGIASPAVAGATDSPLLGKTYEERLLNLKKGADAISENIRGNRPIEKDAIDKIKSGNVSGGVSDLFSSFFSSSIYMALASSGIGTAFLFESLAVNKYAELRNDGVDVETALKGAGTSAFVNSWAERVGAKLLGKAISPVKKMKGNGIPITTKEIKGEIKKNLGNALLGEPATEYAQEGIEYAIDQVARDKEVDWVEFNRRGMLGAGSALVGGGSFAGLGSGKNYFFATEQAANNRANAIKKINTLIETAEKVENESTKKSMQEQAKRLMNDLQAQSEEVKKTVNKATPEELKAIEDFQKEIADLQNISDAGMDVGDDIQEVKDSKDELITEIEKRDAEETGQVREEGEQETAQEESVGDMQEQSETQEEEVDTTEGKDSFISVSTKASKNEGINENELQQGIEEGYSALEELEGNNSEDAEIMRSLIEDQIEKLEAYENVTETQTRKVAEERTVQATKKTPRKTTPTREKDFVGKKATYSDNQGSGGRGTITVQEGTDGREYYMLEQPNEDKVILGRRDKAFQEGNVNFDKNGNPTSVTFPLTEGKQVTVKSPEIAKEVELEQMKQEDYDVETFEETYIEIVGEEQVEVPKQKTDATKKQDTETTPPTQEEGESVQQEQQVVAEEGGTAETVDEGDTTVEGQPSSVDTFFQAFDKGADNALDWIQKEKARVKKANRETLGMNLAPAAYEAALTAAELAVKAGKTTSQVIQAAKKAVSEYYKDSTDNQKQSALDEIDTMFNRPVKRNITQETEGLTPKQSLRQGLSEFVASIREKESGKRKKLEESYKSKLKNAKDKLKQQVRNAKDDTSAKNFVADFIKTVSSIASKDGSIKLDDISSSALRSLQSKVKKADRNNLDSVVEEVFQVFESQVRKKRNNTISKKQKKARNKVKSGKAGMNQSAYQGALRINPKFIPNTEFGNDLLSRLEELLEKINQSQVKIQDESGLNLQKEAVELSNMYQEILKESDALFTQLEDFQKRNDSLTKKEAILSMFQQGIINMNQARVLEGYKPPKKVKVKEKEGITEEEQQERESLIGSILANKPNEKEVFDTNEFLRDIIESINSFTQQDLERASTDALRKLNNALLYAIPANEMSNVGKALTSVKSAKMAAEAKSSISDKPARSSILNIAGKIGGIFSSNIKNWAARSKALSVPLENIDFEVFGKYNLKEKTIYKTLLEPLAKAFSTRQDFTQRAFSVMNDAFELMRKEGNQKDLNKSSVKLGVIGLFREYMSNPDNNKVFDPVDVINQTLKSLTGEDSGYLGAYKTALEDVLSEFAEMDGNTVVSLDYDAMIKSLTKGETKYMNNWENKVAPDLEKMGAVVTSAVRGESWSPLINYMPRMTMKQQTVKGIEDAANSALTGDGGVTTSAKAGVNKERTATTAPPMILDIFKAHRRAVTDQSTDYYMTLPLKNAASAIERLKSDFENEGNNVGKKNAVLLESLLKASVENDLLKQAASNNDLEVGWLGDVVNYFRKKGYQFGLGYLVRSGAELGSNLTFAAISYPQETAKGIKFGVINNEQFKSLAEMIGIVRSSQASRLLGQELTSLMMEEGAVTESSAINIGKYNNAVVSIAKKAGESIDDLQRKLLGRPDLATSRVIWIGTFSNEYKKVTGKDFKLDNFTKEDYFNNKEAFDEATRIADERLSEAVSTNNPYAGVLGSMIKPTGNARDIISSFDKYLTRFARQEKSTFKKGAIMAMKGESSGGSRRKGFALMGASAARMALYTQLLQAGTGTLITLAEMALGYGDDDEEDFGIVQKIAKVAQGDKDSEKYLYDIQNEALSALLMIGTGGYGNVSKTVFNFGLESLNMYEGEGLTRPEGEDYNSFDNGIAYSFVSPEILQGRQLRAKDVTFLANANSEAIKTLMEITQNSHTALTKSGKTKEKAIEKLMYRNAPTLIGVTTGIPTKDFVKVANHYLYSDKKSNSGEFSNGLIDLSNSFRSNIEPMDIEPMDIEPIQ